MIKRKYHWIPGYAICDEADKLNIKYFYSCYHMDPENLGVDDLEIGMSDSEWAKVEAELPHLFEKRAPKVLDLRGVFQRWGMESQSSGMMAWQDIAEDEYGDFVKLEDVVKYLQKLGHYDKVVTSKDKSDNWETADAD